MVGDSPKGVEAAEGWSLVDKEAKGSFGGWGGSVGYDVLEFRSRGASGMGVSGSRFVGVVVVVENGPWYVLLVQQVGGESVDGMVGGVEEGEAGASIPGEVIRKLWGRRFKNSVHHSITVSFLRRRLSKCEEPTRGSFSARG